MHARSERAHSVLIVEDERIVAKDLQQTLAALGYDTSAVASSADEAIARASDRCPDVVLMDIRIRGQRDGIETADILKRRFGVPVVYLTAHADEATIERAKLTEPHGYLVKPVKSAELRGAIEVAVYRAEMEKRLRERERWYATTLRSIADAVISVDLAGNITFMNPVAESLIGVKAAQAVGRPARNVLRLLDGDARPHDEHPLDRALRERRAVEVKEATLERAAAGPLTISDSASPVVDEGELLGAVMVFREVTTRKGVNKQLELHDRLTSLGTMAAGVAHEINNPLSAIVGNVEYLVQGIEQLRADLADKGAGAIPGVLAAIGNMLDVGGDVRSASARIARIVSDLRAFSRPGIKGTDATSVAGAVDWAVRTTANELRHRARVTVDLPADLPDVRVEETRLGQVLVNLLVNAAQAIEPGNPAQNEVGVSARAGTDDKVTVEVRDTGCGIPAEALAHIFEPFFTTKPAGLGTGLGLSVCHGIVTSFGGELEVESVAGRGTTFRVLIPVVTARPDNEPTRAPDPAEPPPARRSARILVIDDEEAVLRVIRRSLAEHEVVAVTNGREALRLIRTGRVFDAILSDLMMPEMSGIELYEELLSTHPELAKRMVFITGGAVTTRAADFLRSVPNVQIEKPFAISALRREIERVVA